jgi:sec-independent protein translocase protein TatB
MFDITSSKLLILGIVALLVIGPKDLPALLRTIGKYVGIIKKQAAEFRAQFDEAMRESELEQLKKDVEKIGHETEASMRAATDTVEQQLADARSSVEAAVDDPGKMPDPAAATRTDDLPLEAPADPSTSAALNGSGHKEDEGSKAASSAESTSEPGGTGVQTGA